jgi:hypothetical protein
MDVYSDRISVDQEEQERLRFSADDIIHLPVHTAINIWVARGTPRAAFVASTLPMQDLYDPVLADHHLAAQRARGGHHLAHLPAPLEDKSPAEKASDDRSPHTPRTDPDDAVAGRTGRPADRRDPAPDQLPFEDL